MKPRNPGAYGTDIVIRGGQVIRVITRPATDGTFELWIVAEDANGGGLVDHYFTRDDLRRRLAYAVAGDLVWHPAAPDAIDRRDLGLGFIVGKTMASNPISHSQARYHLANGLAALPVRRRALSAARSALVGSWTDGQMTLSFASGGEARFSGYTSGSFLGALEQGRPYLWHLGAWQLTLVEEESKRGVRLAVLNVAGDELHVVSDDAGDVVAHVFRRGAPDSMAAPHGPAS